MSYSVRLDDGSTVNGLGSGTGAVLVGNGVSQQIAAAARGAWAQATQSSGVFTFYVYSSIGLQPTGSQLTLSVATLNSSVAGARVLVDVGGGIYKLGSVTSDGTSSTSSSGQTFPASSPAATPIAGESFPSGVTAAAKVVALGTAGDGVTAWFTVNGVVIACTLSTAGALSGQLALVSAGGWVLAQL